MRHAEESEQPGPAIPPCNCAHYEGTQGCDPLNEPTIVIDAADDWDKQGHCRVCGTRWLIKELSYHFPIFEWQRQR